MSGVCWLARPPAWRVTCCSIASMLSPPSWCRLLLPSPLRLHTSRPHLLLPAVSVCTPPLPLRPPPPQPLTAQAIKTTLVSAHPPALQAAQAAFSDWVASLTPAPHLPSSSPLPLVKNRRLCSGSMKRSRARLGLPRIPRSRNWTRLASWPIGLNFVLRL